MRSNIIAIFLLVVVTALSAIYWKVSQDYFGEKILWNEAQSRTQLSALTRSVQSELSGFSQVLDLTLPQLLDSKKDYARDQVYSHFHMIATIEEQDHEIRLVQKYFLEGSPVKLWAPTYVPLALHGTILSSIPQNVLLTLLDPKRRPWLLFVSSSAVSQKKYAAILSADSLQGIIDRQKGQMATLAILNGKSQVLGHTTSEYIGGLLREDPLMKEILRSGNGSGSGIFNFRGDRIHGFFELVEGTNLFVTVSTPIRLLMADRNKIRSRFIFMGLGISFVGLAFLMILGGKSTPNKLDRPAQKAKSTEIAKVAATEAHPSLEPQFQPGTEFERSQPSVVQQNMSSEPLPAPILDPSKSLAEEKFTTLFNEQKLNDTFGMIDDLDSPELPPPYNSDSEKPRSPAPSLEANLVPLEVALTLPPSPFEPENMLAANPPRLEAPQINTPGTSAETSEPAVPMIADENTEHDFVVSAETQSVKTPPNQSLEGSPVRINLKKRHSKLDELSISIRRPEAAAQTPKREFSSGEFS